MKISGSSGEFSLSKSTTAWLFDHDVHSIQHCRTDCRLYEQEILKDGRRERMGGRMIECEDRSSDDDFLKGTWLATVMPARSDSAKGIAVVTIRETLENR